MREMLSWTLLILGIVHLLTATLLFPAVRLMNHLAMPFYERHSMLLPRFYRAIIEWIMPREGLQRLILLLEGAVFLLVAWLLFNRVL